MQRVTQRSPISIVRDHLEAWRRENRWSRETLADQIVQAHVRIGGPCFSGIVFAPPTTDTFERLRVNADRIYRWIDDFSKEKNLLPFNFVLSVLTALPDDRRVLMLNDLLSPLLLRVETGIDDDAEVSDADLVATFRAIVDHGSAATIATSHLLEAPDQNEVAMAEEKLWLAASTIKKACAMILRLKRRRAAACA